MGNFGKQTRVSENDSTWAPAATKHATPGKATLTEALSTAAAPDPVQRKATALGAEQEEGNAANASAPEAEEDFKPATGSKETKLTGTFGEFSVKHGLKTEPRKGKLGEYSVNIEMTPNKKAGESKIGFVQAVRSANEPGSSWHTKKDDPGMTADRAKRTDPKSGMRVDRADPAEDKTPFYGMYKDDKGTINAYTTARIGWSGGPKPMLDDGPSVADPRTREFVATAMDMKTGTEFGAVNWGFSFDSKSKHSSEVTPNLVDAKSDLIKGRDTAMDKWNTEVATKDSGIDKVPGK